MKIRLEENLSHSDRATCIGVGTVLSLSLLVLPVSSTWLAFIALTAAYPMLSGLTGIDPIKAVFDNIKLNVTHSEVRYS